MMLQSDIPSTVIVITAEDVRPERTSDVLRYRYPIGRSD